MRLVWKIFNALLGALFIFAAALQYNDPDPVRWMAIYVAAALPCGLALAGRSNRVLPAIVGLVSLTWAVTYLFRGVPTVSPLHMFDEWEMKNQTVVETREMFGLVIVTGWMIVLAVDAQMARRRRM